MYVSYEQFQAVGMAELSEEEYAMIAPMADLVIDNWTLDRVGRSVKNGEDLPASVVTLYVALVENIPAIMDGVNPSKGGLVSSFSNGIDSYTFEVTPNLEQQLQNTLGWMLDLLPVEWISACVSFEGGNRYAG